MRGMPGVPGISIELHEGRAPAECVAIRRRVFIEEQRVPEADELDGKDGERVHFLARDAAGRAIGCACLRRYGAKHKVERVAVLPELRGSGLGRELMCAVEVHARARGQRELVLHAQSAVVAFYEKLGWQSVGERFFEAGIEHQKMEKRLRDQ
jgi:predicted GNAT family N-acyltransferase